MNQALATQGFPQAIANTVTTALGTVAALTWADAIKTLFATGGLFATTSKWAPWMIAVLATILAIWGSRLLFLLSSKVTKLQEGSKSRKPLAPEVQPSAPPSLAAELDKAPTP